MSGNRDHPIAPVMLGDAKLASDMADAMLERGVFVIGFSYPVVPRGEARIRCQISAAHTEEQINRTVDAFIDQTCMKTIRNRNKAQEAGFVVLDIILDQNKMMRYTSS